MSGPWQSGLSWRRLKMSKASKARVERKAKERALYVRLGIVRGVVKSKDDAARVLTFMDKLTNG